MADYSKRVFYYKDYPVEVWSRIGKRVTREAILSAEKALISAESWELPTHTPYNCMVDDKNCGEISITCLCTKSEEEFVRDILGADGVLVEFHDGYFTYDECAEAHIVFKVFPDPTDTASDYWSRDAYLHECIKKQESNLITLGDRP